MNTAASLLLVTRPRPQADDWAHGLQRGGARAQALPLIATAPPAQPNAVTQAWRSLHDMRLVMFVSPAAAQHFFAARPAGAAWPLHTLAAAPGPGTATVVRQLGAPAGLNPTQVLSPGADAAQFDSEHLWPVLHALPWQGARVLIASGGTGDQAQGRQWLSQRWREQGAEVQAVLCYQRGPAQWSTTERERALRALQHPEQHLWLFSASAAIDHLVRHQLPTLASSATSAGEALHHLRALCTHPRVAETARQAGIQTCWNCAPTLQAVLKQVHAIDAGLTPDTIVSP